MAFRQPNRDQYRRRLQETRRWCSARQPIRDPQRDLRTPALEPAVAEWPSFDELDAAVSELAEKRRERIDPGGGDDRGRLLICEYNNSITSGESEAETHGFFDVADRPPLGHLDVLRAADRRVGPRRGTYGPVDRLGSEFSRCDGGAGNSRQSVRLHLLGFGG